ncbi:MAG: arginine N-succinyltransferase [Pseudohongiellaceae bacterium]|jgi:arginine N-succinyltransferase
MLIRLAQPSDLRSLMALSGLLPPGMTSMPFDLATWEKKLELVQQSTQSVVRTDQESVYLLVMEDTDTGQIVGTAGIVAGVGLTNPFYNYKLSKDVRHSEELDIRVTSNLLNLINDFTGETELISLYLMPESRVKYAGQFLSRCRYVFMSDFPERFSDMVFAEIRGWLDESERSPFWKHLGSKFFNLPFAKADFISAVNGSQFISDLMPRFPIYLELLPKEAVDVIGKPHDDSVPALKLLEREGFRYEKTIDIFDAGPVMQCHRSNIASIRNTKTVSIAQISVTSLEAEDSPICILSNGKLTEYRLVLGSVKFNDGGDLIISAADAAALGVDVGAKVSALQIR